jgi:hypothetical protein
MKKILIYNNNDRYVVTDRTSLIPSNIEPVSEIDIESLEDRDVNALRKNPKNTKILNKIKNKKNG